MTTYGTRCSDTQLRGWIDSWCTANPNGRQTWALRDLRAEGLGCDGTRWARLWNRRDQAFIASLRMQAMAQRLGPALSEAVGSWWAAVVRVRSYQASRTSGPDRPVWTCLLEERWRTLRLLALAWKDHALAELVESYAVRHPVR